MKLLNVETKHSISPHSLKKLESSPSSFFKYMITEREEEVKNAALDLGTYIHMYLLERDKFDEQMIQISYPSFKSTPCGLFCTSVSEYDLDNLTDENILETYNMYYKPIVNSKKAWVLFNENLDKIKEIKKINLLDLTNKTVISESDMFKIKKIEESILRHKGLRYFFYPNLLTKYKYNNEYCVEVKYKNYNFKGIIDKFVETEDCYYIIDLKTTSEALSNFYRNNFSKRRMDMQMTFYYFLLKKAKIIKDDKPVKFLIAAASTVDFNCELFTVNNLLDLEEDLFDKYVTLLNRYEEKGSFDFPLEYYENDFGIVELKRL